MDDHQVTLVLLFVLAAVAAAAGAPVRPTQVTLMPALARSPGELVAANTVWSTGEGLGAFGGPFVAGALMAAGLHAVVAAVAAVAFLVTAAIGGRSPVRTGERRLGRRQPRARRAPTSPTDVRAVRRRPVLAWSMLGTYGQAMTRGLLNALVVVAAIELLSMGQAGWGCSAPRSGSAASSERSSRCRRPGRSG